MTTSLARAEYEKLHGRLRALNERAFRGVAQGPAHIARMTDDSLDERRSREQLELVRRESGAALHGRRLLEIGAGIGLTVAVARREFEAEAYGIEPGAHEYDGTSRIAADLLDAYGLPRHLVLEGLAEDLPFADGAFDVVVSSNVLEHVTDPARVVAEAVRVLAPGGVVQLVVPNYGSWWEGHYGILWFPHLPAALGKLYVRLLGRDPSYVDRLQLVSPRRLRRWLAPHAPALDVLGWGDRLWEERVRTLQFTEYAALARLKHVTHLVHRLHLTGALVRLGRRLHWETPIVLTARKRRR